MLSFIKNLFKNAPVAPEIDYDVLSAKVAEKLKSEDIVRLLDINTIAEKVSEIVGDQVASNIDASDFVMPVAEKIDVSEIAECFELSEIAECFDTCDIADCIPVSDIAENIDTESIAQNIEINPEDVASYIDIDDLAKALLKLMLSKITA